MKMELRRVPSQSLSESKTTGEQMSKIEGKRACLGVCLRYIHGGGVKTADNFQANHMKIMIGPTICRKKTVDMTGS